MPEASRPKRPRQGARTAPRRRQRPKAPVEPAAAPGPPAAEAPVEVAAPPPEPAAPSPEAAAPAAPAARTTYELLWDAGLLNVLALAGRDVAALFRWPLTYAIGAALVAPVAVLGYLTPVLGGQPVSMASVFDRVALASAFLVPLVTMRLLAEERHTGSLEQLLASPVRYWEVTLAKWLAGLVGFLAGIAFTLVYVALLAVSQPGFDAGAVAGGYVGMVLVGAAWVAVGLLAASLAPGRIAAAAAGIAALLVLQYLLGAAAGVLSPPLSDLLDAASAGNRAAALAGGQVALRDVVYFAALTAAALFLTARVLASRRWR